ncbi:MAG: LAGLIDADG DNA endonuclease family protein [Bacteriophage sp.]|nr:MAG: LAGLIDADG DNA endonuclease family protein [Bacteriophage sp.]
MKEERKEFEEKFLKMYKTGLSTREICKKLNVSESKGYNYIRKHNLKSNKTRENTLYSKEILEIIKKEYLNGSTIKEIQNNHPELKGETINYHLRKMKITRKNGKVNLFNQNYFENINTPQKAYFLGLLMADGCVLKRKFEKSYSYSIRLELKIEDKYIIEEFKKEINGENKIGEYKNKNKHNAYINLNSLKMGEDLIKWGCGINKNTHTTIPNISQKLKRYFLLGYYDGDGIASVGIKSYMGFVGRKPILENIIKEIFNETNIKIPSIWYNKSSHIYCVQYTTKQDKKQLFNYFYNNLNIPHLIRKEIKLKKVLFL